MNLLGLLLGATAVKQLTDYPAEIRHLRKQLPKEERGAFIRDYKQLSGEAKTQFKDLLRQADLKAAGSLVGRDLTPFKAESNAKPEPFSSQPQEEAGTDIIDRVNRILAVPTDIDPALVAEAARKYDEAALPKGADIIERTNRILDLSR